MEFDQGRRSKNMKNSQCLALTLIAAYANVTESYNQNGWNVELQSQVGLSGRPKGNSAFRVLILSSLIAAIVQVTLGGVVRVTESGLGCPDWPLCYGELIPPFETPILIEYSHRLSASLLGLLVLVGTIWSWRIQEIHIYARWLMSVCLVLVIVAAGLGGATVIAELAWWLVLLHLAVAEILVGCIAVLFTMEWKTTMNPTGVRGIQPVSLIALIAMFILILFGSYMVGNGYGSSCGTWPLCDGTLIPNGEAYFINMTHRYLSVLVGLLICVLTIMTWKFSQDYYTKVAASVTLCLFAIQILLGATMIWSGFMTVIKSAHLVIATLSWAALVCTVVSVIPDKKMREQSLKSGMNPLESSGQVL